MAGTGQRVVKAVSLLAGGLILVEVLAVVPFAHWANLLSEWIRSAGAVGVIAYAVVYVLAAVFLLPGSVLTLGAGLAYGPVWGTLLVSPVSVVAATLAFAIGRTVARDRVAARMSGDPRFVAIDTAIGEEGFKVVALLRLSPVLPFNLLNYALGLTRVSTRDFVLASFIGMLPGTLMYVYLGSLATAIGGNVPTGQADGLRTALYWGGLAATVLVTVVITRSARRTLARTLESR